MSMNDCTIDGDECFFTPTDVEAIALHKVLGDLIARFPGRFIAFTGDMANDDLELIAFDYVHHPNSPDHLPPEYASLAVARDREAGRDSELTMK